MVGLSFNRTDVLLRRGRESCGRRTQEKAMGRHRQQTAIRKPGKRSPEKSNLPALWCWTCSLQESQEINVSSLTSGTLLWQPRQANIRA